MTTQTTAAPRNSDAADYALGYFAASAGRAPESDASDAWDEGYNDAVADALDHGTVRGW